MRILIVTTVHTPLDARIHHRQLRSLIDAGWDVTYAAPWRATGTSPGAVVAGTEVVDLPRAVGRHRLPALLAARRVVRRLAPGHDLVLLHDPELLLAVPGRIRRRVPVVLDVHEDLAASLPDRRWVPARLRRPVTRAAVALERWAERHVTLLLAEDGYRARFRGEHPVVPNLPWIPTEVPPAASEDRVVQVGRLSTGRGVAELLSLGARLAVAGGPTLHLIGAADTDVEPAVRAAVARGELVWHGYLPNAEALALVEGSVAGLSLLHDLPNYRVSRPTKLVEYLAHGVPAVTTPLPAAVELLTRIPGGLVVPFGDVTAVAEAVLALAHDPAEARRLGAAGRAGVAAVASWDAAAPDFVAALTRAVTSRGGRAAARRSRRRPRAPRRPG